MWLRVNKNALFTTKFVSQPKHAKLNSGDAYIESSTFGDYGVRTFDAATATDAVIAADAANYGNGKIVKQAYKTVSGAQATSGTITGSLKDRPVIMSFQFLYTSKALYEIYTLGYGSSPAPNTQYFFTAFKPN
jgi:hypothetical protein